MSLFESGDSTGEVSLGALLGGASCSALSTRAHDPLNPDGELRRVTDALCRGGRPACAHLEPAEAQEFLHGYLEELCRVDVRSANGVRHDPTRVRRAVASLARNTATTPSGATPAALLVITATGHAYERPDGVAVAPLTMLGP